MDDRLIVEAAASLRRVNKIPTLNLHLPSETLKDGRVVFLCDNKGDQYLPWINFYVFLEVSDFSPNQQRIDIDAKITKVQDLEQLIMMRIAYRIWNAFKDARQRV